MAKQSQSWKNLERQIAKVLGGRRISRGDDFARMDVDVVLDDLPELRIDGKYRKAHAHHTFMKEVQEKYCTGDQEPVLVTKTHNQTSAYVTVRLEHYAFLLNVWRAFLAESK